MIDHISKDIPRFFYGHVVLCISHLDICLQCYFCSICKKCTTLWFIAIFQHEFVPVNAAMTFYLEEVQMNKWMRIHYVCLVHVVQTCMSDSLCTQCGRRVCLRRSYGSIGQRCILSAICQIDASHDVDIGDRRGFG